MEQDFKCIHGELLVLMDEFHRICIQNDIHYSLHGGTLLGAVREKGFIPWDDDADVALSRSEFERFKEVVNKLQKEGQLIFRPDLSFGARLIMSRTGKPKVWLDIYIYDYISEIRLVQKIKFAILAFLMAWSRSAKSLELTKMHGMYRGWKYAVIYLIHCWGMPFSNETKSRVMDRIARSFQGKKKFIHRANDQYIALKIVLPAEIMNEFVILPFETSMYMLSKNYHEVLVSSYGEDYMIPKKINQDIEVHDMYRNQ